MGEDAADVLLVNMPFSLLKHPPLGLGLLKGGLTRRGLSARVLNFNLRFGKLVGTDTYDRMAMSHPTVLAGEWVFSHALWDFAADVEAGYFRDVLGLAALEDGPMAEPERAGSAAREDLRSTLQRVRSFVDPFLARCLDDAAWQKCRVVGLTSVFEQHVASLSLAKRLKAAYPHLFIVMGGANCEGPMGKATLQGFPFLDAVCSGEGDLVFPDLVERVLRGESLDGIPGIQHRAAARSEVPAKRALPTISTSSRPTVATNTVHDMDALPYPDFDEYFEDVRQLEIEPRLVFETSRGCWWGAKQHCTFCGLNGSSIAFRAKSAERAMQELTHLLERYGSHTRAVSAVDNIIPLQYFKDFLPNLRDLGLELELFYETKANLKKEQIELYRDAGLTSIQPGIESLSTPVLRLMRKGITQLQNVQLLKWCTQYGVDPMWNYIIGFPGEKAEDYAGQDELVRSIAHLPPPDGWGVVRFDRFSPYFMNPEEFGLTNMQPYPAYRYVYRGLDASVRRDLAYYFEADYNGKNRISDYSQPLVGAIDDWIANAGQYALFSLEAGARLQLFDLRPNAASFVVTLEGAARLIYEACDAIAGRPQLLQKLEQAGYHASELELERAMAQLIEHRLLAVERDHYLALGIPLGYRWAPSGAARVRFIETMRSLA